METASKRKRFVAPRPLFYGFLALFFAISTAKFIFDGEIEYIILDVVVLCLFVGGCIFFRSWKTLASILAIFAFGLGWFMLGYSAFMGQTYAGTVEISGRISDDVQYSTYGTSVTVVLKDVSVDGKSENNISLTISLDGEYEPEIGDKISFEAELESVELFVEHDFYSSYYRDRTPYTASVSSDDITKTGNSTTLAEKFRMQVKEVLYENMSSQHASTAYAVLFGDKNDLDSDVEDAYNSAGIVHLLSVSGLHVSFLIALFGWVLQKCRVKGWKNAAFCAIFALVYAYLCGFTPSVLRAGIMGVLLFSTATSGKKYDSLSSVGGAGILILFFSPLSACDVGFRLSFFCVISIVAISPLIKKVLEKIFPKKVASAFSLTISATLGTAPFVASIGGGVAILGFFTNLVVVPVFSVVFPLLFVSVLLVMILPFLGFVLKLSEWGFQLIYLFAQFMGLSKLQIEYEELNIFAYACFFLLLFSMSKLLIVKADVRFMICTALLCVGICSVLFYQTDQTTSAVEAFMNTGQDAQTALTNILCEVMK